MNKGAIAGLLVLFNTSAANAEMNGAALVGQFKQWCMSGPLDYTSFSAAVKKRGFPVQFDKTSPVYDEFQLETKIWTANDGNKNYFRLVATIGTKSGKPLPMSCAVGINGLADKVLAAMQSDPRFGTSKKGLDTDAERSWAWKGPTPQSQVRLSETDHDTSAAQTQIQLEPILQ
jgi:hypothetical protein